VPPPSEARDETERGYELPAFFEPAFANREVRRGLWLQTRYGWVESPVPPEFRLALLKALAERSPWPWRAVADEADRLPRTVRSDRGGWPAEAQPEYDELLDLTLKLVLDGADETIRMRLQDLLGPSPYGSLIAFLTYLETCRTYAQAHPGLAAAASSPSADRDARSPAIFEVDQDGLIVSCSSAAEELFGQSAAALTDTAFRDLFADEHGHAFDRCIADLRTDDRAPVSEHSFKLLGRRGDQSTFDAIVTVTNRARNRRPGRLTAVVEARAPRADDAHRSGYRLLMSMAEGGLAPADADPPLAGLARTLGWEYMLLWRFD
jgi:PAS domain S-box-containing protein